MKKIMVLVLCLMLWGCGDIIEEPAIEIEVDNETIFADQSVTLSDDFLYPETCISIRTDTKEWVILNKDLLFLTDDELTNMGTLISLLSTLQLNNETIEQLIQRFLPRKYLLEGKEVNQ